MEPEDNLDPGYTAPFTINGLLPTYIVSETANELIVRLSDGSLAGVPAPEWSKLPVLVQEPVPIIPVPEAVSMAQARVVLRLAGILPAVEAALAATGNPINEDAWEYSTQLRRDSALVQQMAAALGLTDVQVDALFVQAIQVNF